MSDEHYYLYWDGQNRFLLQRTETGIIEGLLFPGMPGESARAFSYDYGSVWYPNQILNLGEFPDLAEMPFFTIEYCDKYQLSGYFKEAGFQHLWPLLSGSAKFTGFSLEPDQSSISTYSCQDKILWQYTLPNPKGSWTIPILDLWVNEQGCWFCTREGQVLVVNHQGEPIQQYELPKLTRCLTGIEEVPYVSCDDGNLYDLTAKLPQIIYTARPRDDYRYAYQILAIHQSSDSWLVVDAYGNLQGLNADLEPQWQQHQADYWQPWFLQSDTEVAYLGHYHGVNAYDLKTGQEKWMHRLNSPVLCGELTQKEIIIGCSDRKIYSLDKFVDPKTNELAAKTLYTCTGVPYSITLAPDSQSFFIGDYTGKIEHINWDGSLKFTYQLSWGAITALKGWDDRLYATTSQGVLICLTL